MSQIELKHGSATDVGHVREVNEDAFLAAPPVFVVADGMGGHEGGDVASEIVVEEFARLARSGYDPRDATAALAATLDACQDRIGRFIAEQREGGSAGFHAGTTAVAAVLVETDEGPGWLVANLGDSRAYHFHEGVLEQVSLDHSVVQDLLEAGVIEPDDVPTHPERNVITRALGGSQRVTADFFSRPASGRLLLCTDGVTGMIGDDAMAEILAATPSPGEAADRLVAAALEAGGRDNATAVVVDALGAP